MKKIIYDPHVISDISYRTGLFTCNVFQPVCVIATVKVYHCANGDGVNNGQNGIQTHFLDYSDDDKNIYLITVIIMDMG